MSTPRRPRTDPPAAQRRRPARSPRPSTSRNQRDRIGQVGEAVVVQWLRGQGWQIVAQRWRCRWGELDAIALSGDRTTLAFVEVKTRSPGNWDAGGRCAISAHKQTTLVRSALQFLGDTPLWDGLDLGNLASRFDVAIVEYRGDVATRALANTAQPMASDPEAAIAPQSIQIGEPVTLDLDAAGTMTVTLQDYLVHAFTAESAFA